MSTSSTARIAIILFALLAMVVGFLEADRVVHWPDESSSAPEAQEVAVTVVMRNFRYVPEEIRVPVGTRVVFVNEDEVPHNVVHSAGQRVGTAPSLFESPVLQPGEQWSFVFTEPGEYSFLCTVSAHQLMGMVGRIIVEELPPVANSASAR